MNERISTNKESTPGHVPNLGPTRFGDGEESCTPQKRMTSTYIPEYFQG